MERIPPPEPCINKNALCEPKVREAKLPGQRLMARDFDRQVAEFQVRMAVLNGYTALGISVTKVAGQVCPGEGEVRPSTDLCNKAPSQPQSVEELGDAVTDL